MSTVPYRKLKVLLNQQEPLCSRVIDVESGEDLLVTNLQIKLGHENSFASFRVTLELASPGIEIAMDESEPPAASPFLGGETP